MTPPAKKKAKDEFDDVLRKMLASPPMPHKGKSEKVEKRNKVPKPRKRLTPTK